MFRVVQNEINKLNCCKISTCVNMVKHIKTFVLWIMAEQVANNLYECLLTALSKLVLATCDHLNLNQS